MFFCSSSSVSLASWFTSNRKTQIQISINVCTHENDGYEWWSTHYVHIHTHSVWNVYGIWTDFRPYWMRHVTDDKYWIIMDWLDRQTMITNTNKNNMQACYKTYKTCFWWCGLWRNHKNSYLALHCDALHTPCIPTHKKISQPHHWSYHDHT